MFLRRKTMTEGDREPLAAIRRGKSRSCTSKDAALLPGSGEDLGVGEGGGGEVGDVSGLVDVGV